MTVGIRIASPITATVRSGSRSEERTSELQSHVNLVCRLLLEKKKADRQLGAYRDRVQPARLGQADRQLAQPARLHYARRPDGELRVHHRYFFFNDPATTEIYTLSLHDALPI